MWEPLRRFFSAFHEDIRRIGEELLGMVMDVIGNLNIYFHNRRTGEQLGYARLVSGTYRKLTVLILVSSIPTAMLGYICRRLVTKAAISPLLPGICILITGIFLLVTDLSNIGGIKTPKDATYDHACGRHLPGNLCISRTFQMRYDSLRRYDVRLQKEICGEIFLSDQYSGCNWLLDSGAWPVYHTEDDGFTWIYICSWHGCGRSSRLFYDPLSASDRAAYEIALFCILLLCGWCGSADQ